MQYVKQILLPIQRGHNRLTIGNQQNHFLNQFQSTQTIIDQTNISYSFNTSAIVYVDSELNKIIVESKQN